MFEYGFWDGVADDIYVKNFDRKIRQNLNDLEDFRADADCPMLFEGSPNGMSYYKAVNKSSFWKFKNDEETIFNEIENSEDKCQALKEVYPFLEKPLSPEEAEFPIGYGMLIYSGLQQIMYEMSSFYQPQNAYCIAVDGRSTEDFVRRIKLLQECFPNIHIFRSAPIEYCRYEIIHTLWKCVEKLSFSSHPWKYFQYLSGVDLPLKTNREMVRIFKALNGSFNVDIMQLEPYRIPRSNPPLQLWKSSMSAVFSRESANFMVRNPTIQIYLRALRDGYCQDESLWGTIASQPDRLPMPGGFNGTELFRKVIEQAYKMKKVAKIERKPTKKEPFPLKSYYISRYQVWDRINFLNAGQTCKGRFVKASCVFGPNSLEDLVIRPELVVHKLYFDLFPATFFCLYEKIWQRALDINQQELFDASAYSNLALVKYQQTGSLDGVDLYF